MLLNPASPYNNSSNGCKTSLRSLICLNVVKDCMLVSLLMSLLMMPLIAKTEVIIDILGTDENRLPFTVLPFKTNFNNQSKTIETIITNNLIKSGYFRHVDLGRAANTRSLQNINYHFYRAAAIESLITGELTRNDDGSYDIQISLFDILLKQKSFTIRWNFPAQSLRYSAHLASDIIFNSVIGKPSSFTSRLAYVHVNFLSDNSNRYSLLYADSDGKNSRPLISSPLPLVSPAWSPNGEEIAYISYEKNVPDLFIHNVFTGKRRSVIRLNGSSSAPAWAPDGGKLVLSIARQQNTDIYEVNLQTNRTRRITRNPAIDTEPTYTPDGQAIIFTSNRLGKPNLYVYSFATGRVSLLSETIKSGYAASVSNNPNLVAFLSAQSGNFNIAIYNRRDDTTDLLTNSQLNDSPTLSTHGLFLLFSQKRRQQNSTSLYLFDTLTRTRRTLATIPGDVKNIAWGPPQDINPYLRQAQINP